MRPFLRKHADDLLITLGAGLVIYATYLLSAIAALYVAGIFCIGVGVMLGIGGAKQ